MCFHSFAFYLIESPWVDAGSRNPGKLVLPVHQPTNMSLIHPWINLEKYNNTVNKKLVLSVCLSTNMSLIHPWINLWKSYVNCAKNRYFHHISWADRRLRRNWLNQYHDYCVLGLFLWRFFLFIFDSSDSSSFRMIEHRSETFPFCGKQSIISI